MKISLEQIELMAEWSKLSLGEQEKELFMDQLNKILEKIAIIETLNIDDMGPYTRDPVQRNVLREDRVHPSMRSDLILENAPDPQDGMFGVPSILE